MMHDLCVIVELFPGSSLLYPEHPKLSLVQMSDMVSASVDNLVQHCAVSTGKCFSVFMKFQVHRNTQPAAFVTDYMSNYVAGRYSKVSYSCTVK